MRQTFCVWTPTPSSSVYFHALNYSTNPQINKPVLMGRPPSFFLKHHLRAMPGFFFFTQNLKFLFVFVVSVCLRPMLRFIRSKIDGPGLLNNKIEEEEEELKTEEIYLKFKFPTYQEFAGEISADPSNNGDFLDGEFSQTGGVHENIQTEINFTENAVKEDQGPDCHYGLIDGMNSVTAGSDSESLVSHGDGFLSDRDFEGELDTDNDKESSETGSELSGFEDPKEFSDQNSDVMEELKKLEENPSNNKRDFLSDTCFNDDLNCGDQVEKLRSKEHSPEDENELESLWEHQELVEQLKMELKKVRATGLPTIVEDSEAPKLMEDLKPWKIDEFKRGDCSGELHKFYKSYRDKMRKFDIINYQKIYAMGFLQLKDPLKSISIERSLAPTLKSLVSRNLGLFKHKIHGTDPMKRFFQELQGDLEVVYVGQMCLSWEFLHWQYERALDLWDSDRGGAYRRYNEVSGEFQQFQVLLQRFIEDEPFQGPRVQNYVKTRCAVRNLLQVPVIKEDNLKDKRKAQAKGDDDYTITSDMLVETVEESIRIFWRFVRADKDCTTPTINGHKPELAAPKDLELLMEIKKNLHKKERKLKDILRSENCILRKFRQCRDNYSDDQVLYFFSQVDMRLVCRVLSMSKVTNEQLVWCRNKLNRICFVNRRIHVDPTFLLFPC